MQPAELVTLTMRELDRLKVIQAVTEARLKPDTAPPRRQRKNRSTSFTK